MSRHWADHEVVDLTTVVAVTLMLDRFASALALARVEPLAGLPVMLPTVEPTGSRGDIRALDAVRAHCVDRLRGDRHRWMRQGLARRACRRAGIDRRSAVDN